MTKVKSSIISQLPAAWITLVGLNVVISLFALTSSTLLNLLILEPSNILQKPWSIITMMFIHADVSHLFFNMFALFMFGSILESQIGTRRFYIIYFTAGILGAFSAFLPNPLTGDQYLYERALGASGAVMGIIGALIMILPKLKILFFFFIPMNLWVAGVIWFLLDFLGLIGTNNVANFAHLIGMGIGLYFGWVYKKMRRNFTKKLEKSDGIFVQDASEYMKQFR